MTDMKPGDLVRIIQQYLPSGIISEIEGKVTSTYGSTAVLEGGFLAWFKDKPMNGGYVQVAVEVLAPPIDFLPVRAGDVIQCAATTYSVVGDQVYYTRSGTQPVTLETVAEFTPWLEDWHRQNSQRAFGFRGKGAQLLFRLESS